MTDFGQRRRILPKTGQAMSYRTGDDGYYEKGWDEGVRFKNVGDGTVIDIATSLMWPKDWSGDGGNSGNVLVWNDAIDWAEALTWAGYSDWRLPNNIELISLYNLTGTAPFIHDVFDNVPNNTFWSSSTDLAYPLSALHIRTDYVSIYSASKNHSKKVIAVRNV